MNDPELQSDVTVDAIRAALDAGAASDPSASVERILRRIDGRTPAQMADRHRARINRSLSVVAAAVLVGLIGWSERPSQASSTPSVLVDGGTASLLEENGYGSYSSASAVLSDLFFWEVEE